MAIYSGFFSGVVYMEVGGPKVGEVTHLGARGKPSCPYNHFNLRTFAW